MRHLQNLVSAGPWPGAASLVVGLFSLTLTWFPLLGGGAIPLAVLGLILGLVGLVTARGGRAERFSPVLGVVIGALALLVPIAMLSLFA